MGLANGFENAFMRLHQSLYVRTDGRVGHGMLVAVPSLLLRTTGRRSGVERTTALVYARDGEDYVLVASNGARDVSPGWYFNLCADPRVELQVRRKRIPGVARAVNKGDADYERLWRLVNDANKGRYDGYQKKTARPIPLVSVHTEQGPDD
jgi:deazaflavin-dependent oxidoreductase (nitroreductase family)